MKCAVENCGAEVVPLKIKTVDGRRYKIYSCKEHGKFAVETEKENESHVMSEKKVV